MIQDGLATEVVTDAAATGGGKNNNEWILIRERTQKALLLKDMIISMAGNLFDSQIALLDYQITNQLKTQLIALAKEEQQPLQSLQQEEAQETEAAEETEEAAEPSKKTPGLSADRMQQLLRNTVFAFETSVHTLEDNAVEGLTFDPSKEKIKEFTNKWEQMIKEFPESVEMKLLELQKVERSVIHATAGTTPATRKRGGKRGSRRLPMQPSTDEEGKKKIFGLFKAFNIGLQLVGMLRPPGYGNLQGFIGYATSLVGLPLDLLLGVMNDGDSIEVSNNISSIC